MVVEPSGAVRQWPLQSGGRAVVEPGPGDRLRVRCWPISRSCADPPRR
jgi:hypothetical protein